MATQLPTSGERLLNEVFDLLRRDLPRLPLDDPTRPPLTALMPELARTLGRSTLSAVNTTEGSK